MAAMAAAMMTPGPVGMAGRKRKSPLGAGGDGGAAGAAGAAAAAGGPLAAVASNIGLELELGPEAASMTVEQFLHHQLEVMLAKADALVDDAVDAVTHQYKTAREELQGYRHVKRAELAAKNKAARKKVWDVELTVVEVAEGSEESLGKVFTVAPRQTRDKSGMCKVGRSTGDDFKGTKGVSLPTDCSVSTWHGKLTSVWGVIYYTDLNTKNGSYHNGKRVAQDTPVALKSGDTITVGDTTLSVRLTPAMLTPDEGVGAGAGGAGGGGAGM